jgi:hypothetical protein
MAVLQCEPLPRLAETRESVFQHQVSATPVPEMCKASVWQAEFTVHKEFFNLQRLDHLLLEQ